MTDLVEVYLWLMTGFSFCNLRAASVDMLTEPKMGAFWKETIFCKGVYLKVKCFIGYQTTKYNTENPLNCTFLTKSGALRMVILEHPA